MIAQQDAQTFLFVIPREWANLIVQLRQSGPMEISEVPFCEEVCSNLKRLRWDETIDVCLLERGQADGLL